MASRRSSGADDSLPELLRKGGPPQVKNHTGGDLIRDRQPVYEVFLPGGVFTLVWELVEAKAKHNYKYKETLPHVVEAHLDAVRAFREAAGEQAIDEDDDIDDGEIILDDDEELTDDDDVILDDDEIIEDEDDEVLL